MTKVLFKLEYTVRELRIQPEIVLTFDYDGPHKVKVVLRSLLEEERTKYPSLYAMVQGTIPSHALCTASSVIQPNEKVRDVFAKIAANQVIPKDSNSIRVSTEYSTPEGLRVRIPALSKFPESFRSFMKKVMGELDDFSVRTVSVVRWRVNSLGPHNPIGTRDFHWSLDGNFWHPAPRDTGMGMRVYAFLVRLQG